MKRLFLILLLVCNSAWANITDLKLSTAQMFDVQWSISGSTLYTSGYNYIYASINYTTQTASAARLTSSNYADINSVSGRYIGFFASTTNPGTYGMAVFNPDGTKYKILNNTGTFRALADGAIFYLGNGSWGTLITTGQGYNLGSSATFTVTTSYPSNTQLQAYTPPSSTPLAAGQTASSLCCGGSSSSFSASQTNLTKINTFATRLTNDSKVYIEQIGNSNTITVQQTGTRNNNTTYAGNGSSNNVTITQSGNNTTQANYVDLTVHGNNNTVGITQTSTGGGKGTFATISDNNNNVTVLQKDSGSDYLNLNLSGGSKTVSVTQQGSASHMADINLSGAGSRSLTLTQQGATQQFYSINSTCASNCQAITVTQGQ